MSSAGALQAVEVGLGSMSSTVPRGASWYETNYYRKRLSMYLAQRDGRRGTGSRGPDSDLERDEMWAPGY